MASCCDGDVTQRSGAGTSAPLRVRGPAPTRRRFTDSPLNPAAPGSVPVTVNGAGGVRGIRLCHILELIREGGGGRGAAPSQERMPELTQLSG